MHACVRGREVIVNLMIDHGADPQAMDKVHTQTNTICCCISSPFVWMCVFLPFQRGETCLNFQETLRNQTILKRILKEYQKHQVSVDVESLVNKQYIPVMSELF